MLAALRTPQSTSIRRSPPPMQTGCDLSPYFDATSPSAMFGIPHITLAPPLPPASPSFAESGVEDDGRDECFSPSSGPGAAAVAAAMTASPTFSSAPTPMPSSRSSRPMARTVDPKEVTALQEDAARFGHIENSTWSLHQFHGVHGLVPRGEEMIEKLKLCGCKEKHYHMPDGRTWTTVRELFNCHDKETGETKPGLLFTTMEYSTFNKSAKVYKLRESMPEYFERIMAGEVGTKKAWAEAAKIVAKQKGVERAMKGIHVGEKRKRVVVPDEILDFMVETYGLLGQAVNKASLKTTGGRDAFKKRLCDGLAAEAGKAEKEDSEDDNE